MMRIFKKALAIMIVLVVCISSINVNAAASVDKINNKKYDEPISFFEDLGVIRDMSTTDFNYEVGITRAEYAILLASILGYSNDETAQETIFTDVPEDNPAYNAIAFLQKKNILNGVTETEFKPNDGMIYSYAVRTIVKALGYNAIVNDDSDYNEIVAKYGIFKGVITNDSVLTRADACLILFRSLDVPLLEMSVRGDAYAQNENKTILSEYLKADIYTGIVTGVGNYSIYGSSSCDRNEIIINYNIYTCDTNDKEKYLGHDVKFYVRNTDDEANRIIALYDKSKFSETIMFDAIQSLYGNSIVRYYRNSKLITKRTDNDTFFVYNGRGVRGEFSEKNIMPKYGNVQIIDNEDDGIIDVILIKDYKVLKVENANKQSEKIHFSNSDFIIDTTADNVGLYMNGKNIGFSDVKQNMMANVLVSMDGSYIYADFADKTIDGTVTSCNQDENSISVSGVDYKIIPELQVPSVGQKGEFYLDILGYIAYCDEVKDVLYGYYLGAYSESDEVNSFIRCLTENGKKETIPLNDKVKMYVGEDYVASVSNELVKDHITNKQLIRYKIDSSGKITEIYNFVDKDAGEFGCKGFVRNIVSVGRCTYQPKGYFSDQYNAKEKSALADEDTVVFNLGNDDDYDDFRILNLSEIKTVAYYERMEVFDLSEFGVANCVVVFDTPYQNFAVLDPILIVSNIFQTCNDENELIYSIKGISHKKGEEIEVYYDEDLLCNPTAVAVSKNYKLSNIKVGDVIQCNIDKNNVIYSWRLLNINGDKTQRAYSVFSNSESISGAEYGGLSFFGTICSVNEKYFTIDSDTLPKKRAYKFIDTENQVLLFCDGKNIEKMDKHDIYPGMSIYMYVQPESGYIYMISYN